MQVLVEIKVGYSMKLRRREGWDAPTGQGWISPSYNTSGTHLVISDATPGNVSRVKECRGGHGKAKKTRQDTGPDIA